MKRYVAIFGLCALGLFAQTNRGGISGTVVDSTQAVISGATVIITNEGTNETRRLTTSQTGSYSVVDLEPVNYRLDVELQGFKKSIVEHVKVDTASTTTVNVALEAGDIQTKVTVTAEAPMVNVASGTVGNTISERELQDVPLVNRSVLDLALTLPNVSGDAGSEDPAIVSTTPCPGCNLTIGGGRPMSTLMLADGANNTGVSLARTMVSFTPETVQEFTVQTSNYSAQYGTTGGGVINATTKSGSNGLRGTALWYNRNPAVGSAPYSLASTNRPVPTLKYNQFSLAAGGPLVIPKVYDGRNKTFWFAAVEPEYRRDHLDQYGLMPTDGMRQGDFSGLVNTASGWLPQSVVNQFQPIAPAAVASTGDSAIYNIFNANGNQFTQGTLASGQSYLPFPGNVIPKSLLDTTAQKTLPMIATAGPYYLNSNGLISNIYGPRLLSQDETRYTIRVDQILNDNNRLYGRFTTTPIVKTQGTPISPTNDAAVYSWAKQAMVDYSRTITPTLINDLRLNYTRGRFSNTAGVNYDANSGQNLNTLLGLPNITKGGVPGFNTLFPGSSLGGGGSTATGFGSGGSTEEEDREERYAVTDIVYKNRGNMSLTFGTDISHSLQNVVPLYAALGGAYNFSNIQTDSNGASTGTGGSPWASFLLGVPNGNVTLRNAEVPYYYRWNSAAAFIQDDWKVRPDLTLNIGLRYSLQMPRTEKFDHQGVFRTDLAQSFPLSTPLALANGTSLTSVLVPPFAFSGAGGNSRYLTPPRYRDFEPRFGFAWAPRFLSEHHLVFRGGWGLSHTPISGFAQLPQPDFSATSSFATTVPSTTANPNAVMRLGENPPVLTAGTPNQVVYGSSGAPPSNGLIYLNSLYYQPFAFGVSQNYHTPYVENWNTTLTWQVKPATTIEFTYTGSMGIHLFMPQEDINPKNAGLISAQLAANVSTTGTVVDPLGRLNPFTGGKLTVQNGSLGTQYLGFSSLYLWYDSAANSIRHAGYVNLMHRASHGLTLIANYTLAKSIDDASSAYGDKNILSAVNGQVGGQVAFGGTRANDRSVSTYDQRHVIHSSVIYDIPIGRGRQFLNQSHVLDYAIGGWSVTGLERMNSGFPYVTYISDTNQLGDLTHTVRPNLVAGVPVVNPGWSRSCPIGANCQPYLNPAAFERPPIGALGDAPRTFDGARGPWGQYFDLSLQKNFRIGERRRLQFRVDALNVFNHPTFAAVPNNGTGGADLMGAPSTAALTSTQYNTWAGANNQPRIPAGTPPAGDPGTALLNQINNMVNAQKNAQGVLPADFFTTPLPSNFWAKPANSFDITTLQGYKYYQLRNAYSTSFGTLYNNSSPRYIQFGVKLYF